MINAATGAGAYPVLKRMTEEIKGWNMTLSKDPDVMWISHVPTDEEMYAWLLKKKNMIINRYPAVKLVSRKDTFQHMAAMANGFNSELFDFVPLTFVLPQDS